MKPSYFYFVAILMGTYAVARSIQERIWVLALVALGVTITAAVLAISARRRRR